MTTTGQQQIHKPSVSDGITAFTTLVSRLSMFWLNWMRSPMCWLHVWVHEQEAMEDQGHNQPCSERYQTCSRDNLPFSNIEGPPSLIITFHDFDTSISI
ncbi:hypothetical protein ACHAXS_001780 [Conticribra weissflogii]